MTIALHSMPRQETYLRKNAQGQGADALEYARTRPLTQEERYAFYEAFAEGYETLPPFTPETLARATAYKRD